MAERICFHLDEHIASAVAVGLRSHGVDLTTTAEAGLTAASDEEQLAYARDAGRVLVTHDAGFLRLHSESARCS
jgi:predicted nuclease of predicted toxin-antitoxin system